MQALDGLEPVGLEADFPAVRHSAVLVLLADGADRRAGVLLTRRSTSMRSHSGEISFPGGRIEPGETEVDAALREANEEVGLDPASVEVIGELDHLATAVSNSHIVPVVARAVSQPALAPASPEVERVLWVPIAEFGLPGTHRVERWALPPEMQGPPERTLHFFELDDETVWGATARILVGLFERLR